MVLSLYETLSWFYMFQCIQYLQYSYRHITLRYDHYPGIIGGKTRMWTLLVQLSSSFMVLLMWALHSVWSWFGLFRKASVSSHVENEGTNSTSLWAVWWLIEKDACNVLAITLTPLSFCSNQLRIELQFYLFLK